MNKKDLKISLLQSPLAWEDKATNLSHFEETIMSISEKMEVVVLPEMFSTGFSMQPTAHAEPMDGNTVKWMKRIAAEQHIILTGSIIVAENGSYYNRLLWVQPDGQLHHYDKRHLFGFAGETEQYTAGSKRVVVQVKGWKILLQVCYDLRFPVFTRNNPQQPYDAILYVANWPERRSLAWQSLLPARAIENQCYVIGVNRIGEDGHGIAHSGGSAIYSPMGEVLNRATDHNAEVIHGLLEKAPLEEVREKLPFLKDADGFVWKS